MAVTGIIFSNIHDNNIPELTRLRTIASVPFGCRYRFIDFTLSNMVNANIFNIDVITQSNYQSLMDHLGSGKDWDLARRSGGIKILPPNIMAGDTARQTSYTTRLEALKSVYNSIAKIKDEYVVMSDCDVICNVNFKAIIEDHIKHKADITMAVKTMTLTEGQAEANVLFASDESGRITDVLPYPKNFAGEADVALNIVVMRTDYLLHMVQDAIAHDYNSMTRDFINRYKDTKNFRRISACTNTTAILPACPPWQTISAAAWSRSPTITHASLSLTCPTVRFILRCVIPRPLITVRPPM